MFYVLGDTAPEFVVQVTDRESLILHRHVSETSVWACPGFKNEHGHSLADAAFRSVAGNRPLAVLPVASVDAALAAVA
jgi:ADP-ribose pyrophosphatase YjhB (NUDIX family)